MSNKRVPEQQTCTHRTLYSDSTCVRCDQLVIVPLARSEREKYHFVEERAMVDLLRKCLPPLIEFRDEIVRGETIPGPDLQPRLETLDDQAKEEVETLDAVIREIRTVLGESQ